MLVKDCDLPGKCGILTRGEQSYNRPCGMKQNSKNSVTCYWLKFGYTTRVITLTLWSNPKPKVKAG